MLYTAVIIEPREHPALLFVLTNFLKNLSDDWSFIIYHGTNNIDFINATVFSLSSMSLALGSTLSATLAS